MEQFLKTSEIKIGDRVRDDLGDLEALADSIDKNGLIHAIVVDEDKRLIAGGRRLAAVKLLEQRLGKEIRIRAHMLRHISERKLRVLELEENLQRKDLTELEKSKNLLELAQKKEAEFMAEMAERAKRIREGQRKAGRPRKPGSIRSQAGLLNIPRQTLHNAKQHVEAVEKYPDLEKLPKRRAIRTARMLDRGCGKATEMSPLEYAEYLENREAESRKLSDALSLLSDSELDSEAISIWIESLATEDDGDGQKLSEMYDLLEAAIANCFSLQYAIAERSGGEQEFEFLVKAQLAKREMTAQQAAVELGMSRTYFIDLIKGNRDSKQQKARIADFLNL